MMHQSTSRVFAAAFIAIAALSSCTDSTSPKPLREVVLHAVTPINVSAVVGAQIEPAPSVVAVDGNGNPIAGVLISFDATGDGMIANTTAITDTDGKASVNAWTLGTRSGAQTITARSAGLQKVVFTALALPGPVASMVMTSGDKQLAAAGYPLPKRLQVRVVDAFGNPVRGALVTFEVSSGKGTIDGESVAADSDGLATSSLWRLGPASGSQQAIARLDRLEVVFTAEALDRPPPLLFVCNAQICSFDFATGVTTQLTFLGKSYHPAMSPDGRRIAFTRFSSDGIGDIYEMDADGSNVSRRTAGLNFAFPSWSPDSRRLAVATAQMPYWGEVYVLPAAGEGTIPVIIAEMASMPAWSPDGKRIAFVSLSGDDGYHALHVANTDGSGVTEIIPRLPHAIDEPTWSPDGSRIAFSECDQGRCDVHVVSPDGRLLWKTDIGIAVTPAWSPDGRWIAFTLWNFSIGGPRVAYLDARGGGEVTVISSGHNPAW